MDLLAAITTSHPAPSQILLLSSAASHSSPLCFRPAAAAAAQRAVFQVSCSISQIHSYGTVDYERRPALKWSSLYRRIAKMTNPSLGPAAVIEQWEEQERKLLKWDLCRVVKELRKFRRFVLALEVYEWMARQRDRFTFTSSDMAIQIDLIAKVHGVARAEEHFSALPGALKDKRTYGALLNTYGQAKMTESAESTLDLMVEKGYATDALPFNVMMTLYMNTEEQGKVITTLEKMKGMGVKLDVFSYNIWITSSAALGDSVEMGRAVERMVSDSGINPNWTTYSTLATMYIKLGDFVKAESCLKDVEIRMTGRDRAPFNYLLGLYSSIGKREDVYRVWTWYKASFPGVLNLGYQSMLSSLIKLRDIEGAENIYEDWLSTASNYDPRLCNMLLSWWVREGDMERAKLVLERYQQRGGKPKPVTWEILTEGYIKAKGISEAISCMREAALVKTTTNWNWMPNPENIANLLEICKEEGDVGSVDALSGVLRGMGCLENDEYRSLFGDQSEVVEQVER